MACNSREKRSNCEAARVCVKPDRINNPSLGHMVLLNTSILWTNAASGRPQLTSVSVSCDSPGFDTQLILHFATHSFIKEFCLFFTPTAEKAPNNLRLQQWFTSPCALTHGGNDLSKLDSPWNFYMILHVSALKQFLPPYLLEHREKIPVPISYFTYEGQNPTSLAKPPFCFFGHSRSVC